MAQAQNNRRVWFGGKRVYLSVPPRRGWYEICGAKGKTHIHHRKYGKLPLSFTRELCVSCHRRQHTKRQVWEAYHDE